MSALSKNKLLLLLFLFTSLNINAQFFNEIYKDFIKYGTFYAAGNINNSYQTQRSSFFVRKDDSFSKGDIPEVVDVTEVFPFDYRIGFGIRKLARFGYEVKGANFYNGTENLVGLSAPTSAIKGLEYLVHYEKERQRGEEWTNQRIFVRHTGKNHILKVENRSQGNVGFDYFSTEARLRLPIGKKFSISAGAIYRTHEKAYGYNPIEIWLNETEITVNPNTGAEVENVVNKWYELGYQYGYTDHFTTYEVEGETYNDYIWKNADGQIVAYGDLDFRNRYFGRLMNRYNNDIFDQLDSYGEIAPIVGADFYHYQNKFWLHSYFNWIMPYHNYIKGDSDFNYLNRNNWGKGGLKPNSSPEQWSDYQAGIMFGWKVSRSIGIFIEGEYTDFWDSQIYQSNFGFNISFN